MSYYRKTVNLPKWDSHTTEHYRDGKVFAVTEQKRQYQFVKNAKLRIDDLQGDIAARKRKLACFSNFVKKGRHDMACYVYLVT